MKDNLKLFKLNMVTLLCGSKAKLALIGQLARLCLSLAQLCPSLFAFKSLHN
jgi:hypothetical protein